MDEVTKKVRSQKLTVKQDRVTLLPSAVTKIDGWIKQIEEKLSGSVDVNRSDLVNYFLEKQPDVLTKDQIEKIKDVFFDDVRFAQWALQQVKESKKKGESLSLKDVLNLSKVLDTDTVKKPRKAKSTESAAATKENSLSDDSFFNCNNPAKP